MLRIRVSTASAEIIETELITAGRKGLQCSFAFSDDWEGLAKTVIVRGVVKRDVVLVGDTITVPGECLEREQFPLHIGVYGANGEGEIVIPTIWADFGKIRPSARPSGVSPDEVTPNVVAQIQQNSANALYLAQELMRRADSGEFDGADGQDGQDGQDGVSPTISSESITGGHRLTIVDAGGTTTVDVMDGQDGADGVGVPSGGSAGDVLRKASGADYDSAWADSSELTDEIDAELAALNPDVHSDAYSWTLGRNYNSSGSLGSQAGFAITGYFDVKPGTLFVNRSVPVDGAGKTTQVFIHQFSGRTWLRRKGLMNEPHYVAIDDDADRARIAFGYPSDQGVTITQQMIDDNFAIRIVKKVPEDANDVGAVASSQGVAHAGEFLVVGADGNVTTVTMSAWTGGAY